MITIPVVILNYNSSDDCFKCVLSLKKQIEVDLEIIIVDNCSTVADRMAVEHFCTTMKLTFLSATMNGGYNAGNNIGLRYAVQKGYEYVLIANPDMLFPQANYVQTLYEYIVRNPDIAVIGSDIITPEGDHQNPMKLGTEKYSDNFLWIRKLLLRDKSGKSNWNTYPQISTYCSMINGCCLMIESKFLQEMNYFDENVFLFGEERILGRMVEMAQRKMYYLGKTYAVHNHKKGKEGNQVKRLKMLRNSERIYVNKYSGYGYIRKLILSITNYLKYQLLFLKYRNVK